MDEEIGWGVRWKDTSRKFVRVIRKSNEEDKLREAENISVENDCRRDLWASDRRKRHTETAKEREGLRERKT